MLGHILAKPISEFSMLGHSQTICDFRTQNNEANQTILDFEKELAALSLQSQLSETRNIKLCSKNVGGSTQYSKNIKQTR